MARLTVGLVFGFVVGVVAGAAAGLHAQDDDVATVAAEAGVDPTDLRGAVNTTQLDARTYLLSVGELTTRPQAGAAASGTVAPVSIWQRLAGCESTGRWSLNSGNGFFGGLQFDRQTWLAYGGGTYAARADLASPVAQIAVAERLRAARGFAPWPACSRALGLR